MGYSLSQSLSSRSAVIMIQTLTHASETGSRNRRTL